MCSGSNELFMRCRRDTRFRAGYQLRTRTSAANTITTATNHWGCEADTSTVGPTWRTVTTVEVSITLRASTIVSMFSHEKFPDSTSHIWVAAMIVAAPPAIGCG